jgi:alpha-galactosidase
VINVKNPPALSLGENRVYFCLWALMKSPLLLSSDLPSLVPEVIDIINNTDVIAVK